MSGRGSALPLAVTMNGANFLGSRVVMVCFFFQAEDGIRDYKVTGVQTCALPISGREEPGGIKEGVAGCACLWSGAGKSKFAKRGHGEISFLRRRIRKAGEGDPNKIGRASCRERV